MKRFVLFFALAAQLLPAIAEAHGGGCREADKPRCCHMDNSTGKVHCH